MLEFFATYAPMMRWSQDASQSVVPNGWDTVGNYSYGMMGRPWGLVNGMMGWSGGLIFWVWGVLCLVTWFLVALVLIALFRWLWKKGNK